MIQEVDSRDKVMHSEMNDLLVIVRLCLPTYHCLSQIAVSFGK